LEERERVKIDVKTKKNYSFGALQKKLSGIVITTLNSLANNLNADIQKGIETGRDINGKAFTSFKESTVKIRNMRGDGQVILFRKGGNKGKLRKTKITRPTSSKLSFEINMVGKNKGVTYGALHNEGFKTASKSMIPNKQVPAREWFGITKDFQEKGKQYQNALKTAKYSALKKPMG
jgi:phage gpG-like protein